MSMTLAPVRINKSLSTEAKKQLILETCEKFGEVFIHYRKRYRKQGEPWTTQLQGTIDFSDKYIQKELVKLASLKGELMEVADNEILIFSRTNDRFRYLLVDSIFKIEHLGTVINSPRVSRL